MCPINWEDRKTKVKNAMKQCKRCNVSYVLDDLFPKEVSSVISDFYICDICKKTLNVIEYQENHFNPKKFSCVFQDELTPKFQDDILQTYYWVNLNPFPSYKKVKETILQTDETKQFYTKELHNEMKNAYEAKVKNENSNTTERSGFTKLHLKYMHKFETEYFVKINSECNEKSKKYFLDTVDYYDMYHYMTEQCSILREVSKVIIEFLEKQNAKNRRTHRELYCNEIPFKFRYEMKFLVYNDGIGEVQYRKRLNDFMKYELKKTRQELELEKVNDFFF